MGGKPAWPPRSAPRLFVEQELSQGLSVQLDGPQAHYLVRVMRVRQGEDVILCDDLTGEWASKVESLDKRTITLRLARHLRRREGVPDFWLCPALLKKDRFDLVLEKATELGVARIQPVITRRCVADKLNLDRARTIITEAAEQCARTALPELAEPVKLPHLLASMAGARTLFFADEQGGEPAAQAFARNASPAALLTGPEGGFDDTERQHIRDRAESVPVTLGPRILRGETAAIGGVAVWMAQNGDWSN